MIPQATPSPLSHELGHSVSHWITHGKHPSHARGVPGTVLGTGHRRMDQPLAVPELLRLCSHFRVCWVYPRLPEGSSQGPRGPIRGDTGSGARSRAGPHSPGACAALQGEPCGLPPLTPTPTREESRRAQACSYRPLATHLPSPPSFPGLASPSSAPRTATRRTPRAAALMASWRPTTTACAPCSSMAPPTSPPWSPTWPGLCRVTRPLAQQLTGHLSPYLASQESRRVSLPLDLKEASPPAKELSSPKCQGPLWVGGDMPGAPQTDLSPGPTPGTQLRCRTAPSTRCYSSSQTESSQTWHRPRRLSST